MKDNKLPKFEKFVNESSTVANPFTIKSDREFNDYISNIPKIKESDIESYIKQAFKNESGKDNITDVNYGEYNIEFGRNGVIITISNVSTISKNIGKEDLGDITIIYKKSKGWSLAF